MKNMDVRSYASEKGVKLWQIAEAIRVADSNFSRKLRKELPTEEKNRMFSIIDELAEEVE